MKTLHPKLIYNILHPKLNHTKLNEVALYGRRS